MSNYNPIYRKFIDERKFVPGNKMVRAKFYLIKEYEYVDGTKGRFTETTAPIIYTLFVSRAKDIVHAVKVSNVNPNLIKRFFGKFVNEDSYRTYKISGFGKVIELDMDVNELTPKNMNVVGIDKKSQKGNI